MARNKEAGLLFWYVLRTNVLCHFLNRYFIVTCFRQFGEEVAGSACFAVQISMKRYQTEKRISFCFLVRPKQGTHRTYI
jgi:hypothetical protein